MAAVYLAIGEYWDDLTPLLGECSEPEPTRRIECIRDPLVCPLVPPPAPADI